MTKVIVKLESNLGQNVMCIGKFEAEGSVHIVGAVPSLSSRRSRRRSRRRSSRRSSRRSRRRRRSRKRSRGSRRKAESAITHLIG